ncbi:hypothetical protein [Nesterenkonia suensis]
MAAELKAVGPEDSDFRPVESVSDAVEFGTRLDELIQMRRVIARRLDIEDTSARDLAALTKRLGDISKEIEGLQKQWAEEARESDVSSDEEFSAEAI